MQPTTITPATASDIKLFYVCFAGFITTSFGFIFFALIFREWGREFNLNQTELAAIACIDYGLSLPPLILSIFKFPLITFVIFNILILNFKLKN